MVRLSLLLLCLIFYFNSTFGQCGAGETTITPSPSPAQAFCNSSGGACMATRAITFSPSVPAGDDITLTIKNTISGGASSCSGAAKRFATLTTVPDGVVIFDVSHPCGWPGCGTAQVLTVTVPSTTTGLTLKVDGTACNPASGGVSSSTLTFTSVCDVPANPCGACSAGGSGSTWTWTGCQSTDWFNPCNWDRQSLPTVTSDVIIPNTTNKPLITGSGKIGNCYTITVQTGARLDLVSSTGASLNVTKP